MKDLPMTASPSARLRRTVLVAIVLGGAAATAGITALLISIFERKAEERTPYVRVVEIGEDDTDPGKWGKNWPAEYDSYRRTALTTRTRFGGHGGNEAMPEEKLDRDP
jgi:nitrite reductase (cytochrome c-552)